MIEWRDIEFDPNDADKATCTLRNTKGKLPRVIVLDPETVAMLREMPRSNRWPYVFFNDGDEGWYRDLSTRFWQYGQDVQFGARLHDLRHEFAIRKLKQGWSIYRVSAHLGHRSVVTTERYYFRYLTEEPKVWVRASGNNGFD
jgi:integrase/recombinase XerD